jgi:hypothetical protein
MKVSSSSFNLKEHANIRLGNGEDKIISSYFFAFFIFGTVD